MDIPGTKGYSEQADKLIPAYESVSFEKIYQQVDHLFPKSPADVLDIGSGTGRDAAQFAKMGHRVVAVEPTDVLREYAIAHHTSPNIIWLNDGLPKLPKLLHLDRQFDLVTMTAVWMHLDENQRRQAMPKIASLLKPGGAMMLTLRHGPVPAGRLMYDVNAKETVELAKQCGLKLLVNFQNQDSQFARKDVRWTRLAFIESH